MNEESIYSKYLESKKELEKINQKIEELENDLGIKEVEYKENKHIISANKKTRSKFHENVMNGLGVLAGVGLGEVIARLSYGKVSLGLRWIMVIIAFIVGFIAAIKIILFMESPNNAELKVAEKRNRILGEDIESGKYKVRSLNGKKQNLINEFDWFIRTV